MLSKELHIKEELATKHRVLESLQHIRKHIIAEIRRDLRKLKEAKND